ncbi:four helix bundle protein [candidate division WOR-3 bacterium]|nr:four helix bundle protein [candidate division WOR-3 bacterium]
MREVRNYEVFKKAHQLTLEVYRLTAAFPQGEAFGLVQQMRRAAYSIPTNLSEGSAREGEKEFAQFVNVAVGSCEEIRYQLLLSRDLRYITDADYEALESEYESVKKMLTRLYQKLKGKK